MAGSKQFRSHPDRQQNTAIGHTLAAGAQSRQSVRPSTAIEFQPNSRRANREHNLDDQGRHVTDNENDILHKVSGNEYLDFNNDDYYNHGLNDCPDLKDSKFLKELN